MPKLNRFSMDRRSGEDRRSRYLLGYFLKGGLERRSGKERRLLGERRADWVRATDFSSVPGMIENTARRDTVNYVI